ncbi:DUF7344 domain-containing protein [Halomicrobium salinisoli]|uniref:DUF7344 domain-containing protein n=1 Tax=Halomicrobium salinisoli TaxID=2878391 RepID=UPI001CF0BD3A|nr:hypothetical protein [Halomicrobium salinisoli]
MALKIEEPSQVDPELMQVLAPPRRRRIVSVLEDIDALSTESLAASVLADEATAAATIVTDDRRRRMHSSLVHADLPALDDAGVLEYDRSSGWVAARSGPAARSAGRIVSATDDDDRATLEALAHERRQALLACVVSKGPCDLERAARRVAARERDCEAAAVPSDAADDVATSLHHVHLPKLGAADLLHYDPEEKVVVSVDDLPSAVTALLSPAGTESA